MTLDHLTRPQDQITDLLLETDRQHGTQTVLQLLRMAVMNYVAERTGREDGPIFDRMISKIATAITTPCHQHYTL